MVGGLEGANLSASQRHDELLSLLAEQFSLDTRKMADGIVDCRAVFSRMVSIAEMLWVVHSALRHAWSLRPSC